MPIDTKYGRLDIPGIDPDEPVFVVRGKDALAPALLAAYREMCAAAGSPQRHLDGIAASRQQFEAWQAEHHTQVPRSDTHACPTAPVTAESACPSCDTCGSLPCNGGCRNAEWAGEERHVCADEDACITAFAALRGARRG